MIRLETGTRTSSHLPSSLCCLKGMKYPVFSLSKCPTHHQAFHIHLWHTTLASEVLIFPEKNVLVNKDSTVPCFCLEHSRCGQMVNIRLQKPPVVQGWWAGTLTFYRRSKWSFVHTARLTFYSSVYSKALVWAMSGQTWDVVLTLS